MLAHALCATRVRHPTLLLEPKDRGGGAGWRHVMRLHALPLVDMSAVVFALVVELGIIVGGFLTPFAVISRSFDSLKPEAKHMNSYELRLREIGRPGVCCTRPAFV